MKKKYLLASCIFITAFLTFWYFPATIAGSILLVVGLLILIFPHVHQIKSVPYTYIKFSLLQEEVNKERVHVLKALAIITRVWLFPFFLIVYLIYLFVAETYFQNMHFTRLFLSIDDYFLLYLVLFTGVYALWGDDGANEQYIGTKKTAWYGYLCYGFSLFVVGVGMWEVRQYAIELGWMRHLLATSTGFILLVLTTMLFHYRK